MALQICNTHAKTAWEPLLRMHLDLHDFCMPGRFTMLLSALLPQPPHSSAVQAFHMLPKRPSCCHGLRDSDMHGQSIDQQHNTLSVGIAALYCTVRSESHAPHNCCSHLPPTNCEGIPQNGHTPCSSHLSCATLPCITLPLPAHGGQSLHAQNMC